MSDEKKIGYIPGHEMSDTKPLALKWRLTDGLISWSYGTVDVIEQKAYDELEAELAALKNQLEEYDALEKEEGT